MKKSKEMTIGAIISYLTIALNIVSGLIYTPWMVDRIGKADYGLYTLSTSLITLFLVDFGLSASTSRFVSKYLAEGRQDKVNNFLGAVYKLYLILDALILVALVVVYFFLDSIYVKLTPEELEKFKVVYIISASFAVINFPCVTFNGILNAYEKFVHLKLADAVYRILLVLLTVVALLFGGKLYSLVTVHALVGLMVIAYKFFVIKKSLKLNINFKYTEKGVYEKLFKFTAWVTVSVIAQRLIFSITPSILGIVADAGAIAVFGIVTVIEGYVNTFATAINGMFMPKISRIYAEENAEEKLNVLVINVAKWQFALNGLFVAGLIALGKDFILLWMGESYVEAYYGIMLVIIPGLFFNSLQIANTAMVVRNSVRFQAIINLIVGAFNVGVSFILSGKYGVTGACISIFLACMLRVAGYLAAYKKELKLNVSVLFKDCYLRMGCSVVVSTIIGLYLGRLIVGVSWGTFIAKGTIVVIIYLSLVFLVGLSRLDKKRILSFCKGFINNKH